MTTDPERACDASDMDSVEDEDDNTTEVASKVSSETDMISALAGQVSAERAAMVDAASIEKMQDPPGPLERRIKALKELQLGTINIEARFYKQVHALECTYSKYVAHLYERRCEIVTGAYEPAEEGTEANSDEKEEEEKKEKAEDIKGIPEFWLKIFKNVDYLFGLLEEHDEPILKHLYDVKVVYVESDPMGFILEFHFEPNEYFTNSVLTKEYIMKCVPNKRNPFSFEGPEIYRCKGCVIDWKKGKNVTVKTIKKSQKHRAQGLVRILTKTVENKSFFNFFSPPEVAEGAEADVDADTHHVLTSDFETGHYIREHIVPRAVLFYTGEALRGGDDDDYEEEEEEEGDEDDPDEEDEEDEESSPTNAPAGGKQGEEDRMECKQQ